MRSVYTENMAGYQSALLICQQNLLNFLQCYEGEANKPPAVPLKALVPLAMRLHVYFQRTQGHK
jgi:hypothetical protein